MRPSFCDTNILTPIREVKGRVTFEPHDFFALQTIEVDVVYIRWTLRNWADKYVILALRAQIPKLKRGSAIILQDIILPEPGKSALWKEKNARFVIFESRFFGIILISTFVDQVTFLCLLLLIQWKGPSRSGNISSRKPIKPLY